MARFLKIYDPQSDEPFRVSRSKIDLFVECPRCAYLDLRLGIKRPEFPSFTLNNAVDELLKKEFDIHRAKQSLHPLLENYGLKLKPLKDDRMEEWRDALRRGIAFHHKDTNLYVRGGIDDVWLNEKNEFVVVDYKATSKKVQPTTVDHIYDGYKRQVEIYQWLFRQNGFKVSRIAYFVYVNGKSDLAAFDGKLEFDVALIAYEGSDAWVPETLENLKTTLVSEEIPPVGTSFSGGPCDYCAYREAAGKALLEKVKAKNAKRKTKKE
jgi:CRISPR/Cas system-associated exonuclease Cas4 (RecB family)